jgi:hypothetical protein
MNPAPPLRIGTDPVLLLDDYAVAETSDCRQTFHSAVKDPANPIILKTEPWEGRGPYTWGSRVHWNPDSREFELFYLAFSPEDIAYRIGLALSKDGLHWSKPDLGVATFEGKPARNLLPGSDCPMDRVAVQTRKPNRAIVRDPRPDCPPAERYKGICFTYFGECVSFSPDGRGSWKEDPNNPVWFVPSDVLHPMWDPVRRRFTAYYKVWEVTGETPDPSSPTGFRPVTIHCPDFAHKRRPDGLTELWARQITFHPESQARVGETTVLLRTENQGINDGGGGSLTGAWHSRRVIAWAESDDWRHWRSERVVLQYDERDRPDANVQNFFVIHHGGYYLGFPTMHDERGHFEQQLAFSRDGLRWSRPWRGNFIGPGPRGAFDSGMVLAPTDPIITDTQMIFYYGGFDLLHFEDTRKPWSSAIGRASIRRDGFASWDSLPGQTGTLTTQPFTHEGDVLWLNADAVGGKITVDALDEQGRVLPGFESANCEPFVEDSAAYPACRAAVRWKSVASFASLCSRPIRLRFRLQDARLFSFSAAKP